MQINLVCKEDTRAIAEKITAYNYELEETTEKSKERKNCMAYFFPGHAMKNKINFQLHFHLPTYIANGKM